MINSKLIDVKANYFLTLTFAFFPTMRLKKSRSIKADSKNLEIYSFYLNCSFHFKIKNKVIKKAII